MLLWLTAFSLFVTYLVLQTQYFTEQPTSTLIVNQFNHTIQFPSVSICISSVEPEAVRHFIKLNPGDTPRDRMASMFNSTGILCYYGYRTWRQLWNSDFASGSQDCRDDAKLEWIDYPFSTAPTLCLTTNNSDLFATQTGVRMTFMGKLPAVSPFDQLTYGIRKPDQQYEPLLSNFLNIGVMTRARFRYSLSQSIKDCNSTTGGQAKCLSSFQQNCIETACNCTYPVITDEQAADLPEQLHGACVTKNLRGLCNYNTTGYTCPSFLALQRAKQVRAIAANNCTLEQVCASQAGQNACPLPSCDASSFPQVATSTSLSRNVLDGVVPEGGNETEYFRGFFVLSIILDSQTITIIQEVEGYTALSYFGSIGGMMGLLLGFVGARAVTLLDLADFLIHRHRFSVLTIAEWVEGFCKIGKRVEETSHDHPNVEKESPALGNGSAAMDIENRAKTA
jgi:hypothetical protein